MVKKSLEILKQKAKHHLLIDRNEIAQIINKSALFKIELAILTKSQKQNRSGGIMPTLCAVKGANGDLIFSNSTEELIGQIVQDENFKLLGTVTWDLLNDLLKTRFKESKLLKGLKIEIFYNNIIPDSQLELIENLFDLLNSNSANMLNASMDRTLAEVKKIEEQKRYKHSIHETALSIKEFIAEHYRVRCEIYNIIEKDYSDDHLIKENEKTLETYGRPMYFYSENGAVLLFPFTNDRMSIKIEHIFKIQSKQSISEYVITNLTKAFNYYFNSYIPRLVINHISDLQNRIITIHNNANLASIDLYEELKEFSKIAFETIIRNSGAHSATLRIHDPFTKKLLLIREVLSSKESDASTYDARGIFTSDSTSVNAITFKVCDRNNFLYIKDIERYKANQRAPSPIDRKYSKTELCFPFYFKHTIIGTINFESPSEKGFGPTLKSKAKVKNNIEDYNDDPIFNIFFTVKKLIEEYVEILFESNDKLWLSKRIQIYQNIHELNSLTNPDSGIKDSQKEIIRRAIRPSHQILSNDLDINLYDSIKLFRANFLNDIDGKESSKIFADKISLNNPSNSNVLISKESYSFLEILFINIFSNFYKNHNKFYNEIIVIQLVKNTLLIHINFYFKSYSEENRYKYLVCPYFDDAGKSGKIHYGLFLIGMITRHLRGCIISSRRQQMTKFQKY